MERRDWEGLLRALTYGITMTNQPMTKVHTAFDGAINRGALDSSPAEYLEAIETALASGLDLADAIGLEQTDADVRMFLEAVKERLARQLGARS
jgi:hypothetical protein